MANKILEDLKIPANCSSVRVRILNEAMAKNRKIIQFHKITDKRKIATSTVLEKTDELILAQNENRPPNLKKVISHTVNSATLMGRAH